MFLFLPDFNNNIFECITPDQYEITHQFATPQQVQVDVVLENEITILEPLVYENVKEFIPNVNYSSANLVIQSNVEESADIGMLFTKNTFFNHVNKYF